MVKNKHFLTYVLSIFGAINSFGSAIKDLTVVHGNRDNQLVGYGLVSGLDGKGDGNMKHTVHSIANALKNYGLSIDENNIAGNKNVAAVMVTADVEAFSKSGSRIDVIVSSIGDAKTLQGGILLQTPLYGADGAVYAVAQGSVAIGGFLGGSDAAKVQKNHPTVGRIVNGAIVEREIQTNLVSNGSINLNLLNPDFVTAARIAESINGKYPNSAKAETPSSVNVMIPNHLRSQTTNFIADIEMLEVIPDVKAKIIINERTGTIVATAKVKISTVAVSQGNLTITVNENNSVSQANPLAPNGVTADVKNVSVSAKETSGGFVVIPELPTIQDLTSALNILGVTSREMMSILQSMKAAGALQAELVIL